MCYENSILKKIKISFLQISKMFRRNLLFFFSKKKKVFMKTHCFATLSFFHIYICSKLEIPALIVLIMIIYIKDV